MNIKLYIHFFIVVLFIGMHHQMHAAERKLKVSHKKEILSVEELYPPIKEVNLSKEIREYLKEKVQDWQKTEWRVNETSQEQDSFRENFDLTISPQGHFFYKYEKKILNDISQSPLTALICKMNKRDPGMDAAIVNFSPKEVLDVASAHAYYANKLENKTYWVKKALQYNLLGLYLSRTGEENGMNGLKENWPARVEGILKNYEEHLIAPQQTEQLKERYGLNDSSLSQQELDKKMLLMCLDRNPVLPGAVKLLSEQLGTRKITFDELKWDAATHFRWLKAAYAEIAFEPSRAQKLKNDSLVIHWGIPDTDFDQMVALEKKELVAKYAFLRYLLAQGDAQHKKAIFAAQQQEMKELLLRTGMVNYWLPALDINEKAVQELVATQLQTGTICAHSSDEVPCHCVDDQQKLMAYLTALPDHKKMIFAEYLLHATQSLVLTNQAHGYVPLLAFIPDLLPNAQEAEAQAVTKKKKKKQQRQTAVTNQSTQFAHKHGERIGKLLNWYALNGQEKQAATLLDALMLKDLFLGNKPLLETINADDLLKVCHWSQKNNYAVYGLLIIALYEKAAQVAHQSSTYSFLIIAEAYVRDLINNRVSVQIDDPLFVELVREAGQFIQKLTFKQDLAMNNLAHAREIMRMGGAMGEHQKQLARFLHIHLVEKQQLWANGQEEDLWQCLYEACAAHQDLSWDIFYSLRTKEGLEERMDELMSVLKTSQKTAPMVPFMQLFLEFENGKIEDATMQACKNEKISERCAQYLNLLPSLHNGSLPIARRLKLIDHMTSLIIEKPDPYDASAAILRVSAISAFKRIIEKDPLLLAGLSQLDCHTVQLRTMWSYIIYLTHEFERKKKLGEAAVALEQMNSAYTLCSDALAAIWEQDLKDEQFKTLFQQAAAQMNKITGTMVQSDQFETDTALQVNVSRFYAMQARPLWCKLSPGEKFNEAAFTTAKFYASKAMSTVKAKIEGTKKGDHDALKNLYKELRVCEALSVTIEAKLWSSRLGGEYSSYKRMIQKKDLNEIKEKINSLIPLSPFAHALRKLIAQYTVLDKSGGENFIKKLEGKRREYLLNALIDMGPYCYANYSTEDKKWYTDVLDLAAKEVKCKREEVTFDDFFMTALKHLKAERGGNGTVPHDSILANKIVAALDIFINVFPENSLEYAQVRLLSSYYRYLAAHKKIGSENDDVVAKYKDLLVCWREIAHLQARKLVDVTYVVDEPMLNRMSMLIAHALELELTAFVELHQQGAMRIDMDVHKQLEENVDIMTKYAKKIADTPFALSAEFVSNIKAAIAECKPKE